MTYNNINNGSNKAKIAKNLWHTIKVSSDPLTKDHRLIMITRFFYKQTTILIEPQRCLVSCDFQGNLLLSCYLIFIKKIWTLKL